MSSQSQSHLYNNTKEKPTNYFVPESSRWPILLAGSLLIFMFGFANMLHGSTIGKFMFVAGLCCILAVAFNWFHDVVKESLSGLYSNQMDLSFRWSMGWFIVSEIFFFLCFFGALFYIRNFTIHWLGGIDGHQSTKEILWPTFEAVWPLLSNPSDKYLGPQAVISPWGLPSINTALLLTSSVTLTIAHHALRNHHKRALIMWTAVTIALGVLFLVFQATEYVDAYHELGLTLDSGIYGSTFFMLTGFHGLHVTLGTIMITVMLIRSIKDHFTPNDHFAFEATAWYWHFVDVVWLGLFIFVYIL